MLLPRHVHWHIYNVVQHEFTCISIYSITNWFCLPNDLWLRFFMFVYVCKCVHVFFSKTTQVFQSFFYVSYHVCPTTLSHGKNLHSHRARTTVFYTCNFPITPIYTVYSIDQCTTTVLQGYSIHPVCVFFTKF